MKFTVLSEHLAERFCERHNYTELSSYGGFWYALPPNAVTKVKIAKVKQYKNSDVKIKQTYALTGITKDGSVITHHTYDRTGDDTRPLKEIIAERKANYKVLVSQGF